MADLQDALRDLSQAATLLVAADFDGTLSPIVESPDLAQVDTGSLAALKALAAMADTHVAIVSGRSLADLACRVGDARGIHLIGSHGSELQGRVAAAPTAAAVASLSKARECIQRIADRTPGSLVEIKPTGCALHYRNVNEGAAATSVNELLAAAAGWPDLYVRHGKKVVEVSAVKANKGEAVQSLRRDMDASRVLYVGDDLTDEDVFATLRPEDLGVKVGTGPTAARHCVHDTSAVCRMLMCILHLRTQSRLGIIDRRRSGNVTGKGQGRSV